jgi:tetratricopeptide (TPR) repeat protein
MKFCKYLLFGIAVIFLASCGSSDNFFSKGYHNLTSRYNPFFLSNMRMDSIEKAIFDSRKEDYNRILEVIPFPEDTNALKVYDKKAEDCFKKAAIIYNRHENSDFVDKAYILIGKSWFLLRKNDDAINAMKYVNSNAKNEDDKSWALIELLKMYTRLKNFPSAEITASTLMKRKMPRNLQWKFYVARADLFRRQNNYLETAKSLGSAVELMKRGEYKGRIYFILGQLYQKSNKMALAKQNYTQVLRNNPAYEIDFYARLYRAQTTDLNGEKDIKKIEKYYKRLLKDEKNKEYHDKIYYEKGLFSLRSNDIPNAIKHLKTSVRISNNANQKAYSFLKLGEIYYKPLAKYEEAKICYDSAVAFLPKNHEDFKAISKRQKNLEEFVKHLTTYRTEDSLQTIAKISPDSMRLKYIETKLWIIENRLQDVKDSLQKIANENKRRTTIDKQGSSLGENINDTDKWYFSNPNAILNGQREFFKKWGNRVLEDNWRRSSKPAVINPDDSSNVIKSEVARISPEELRKQAIQKEVKRKVKELLKRLPQTQEEFKISDEKIEKALFEIGKIYRLKLQEPENSIQFFEMLLKRFPTTKPEPEVLYSLHLNNKDLNRETEAERYKQLLITKFPNSSFARMLLNPNYMKEAQANDSKVKELYGLAYNLFKSGNYTGAKKNIDEIFDKYKENLIDDKVSWLRIMVNQKLKKDDAYLKNQCYDFIKKYPDSNLVVLVQGLIEKMK